jgi:hypothetical protein
MLTILLHLRTQRRAAHKAPAAHVDARSGAPERRGPAPMPRMRWYS